MKKERTNSENLIEFLEKNKSDFTFELPLKLEQPSEKSLKKIKIKPSQKTKTNCYKEIEKAQKIGLFYHSHPDADAVGATSALAQILTALGKNVCVLFEEQLNTLKFVNFENITIKFEAEDLSEFDLLIALDTSASHLLGKFENAFLSHKNKMVIDHHFNRTPFADFEFIDDECPSACEVLFNFISKLDIEITPEIATSILTGIVGDTGRFLHSTTKQSTLEIASKLMKLGANLNLINTKLYKSTSLDYLKALRLGLNNMEINKNIAVTYLSMKDYKHAKIPNIAGSELINTLINISFIDLAIVLYEQTPGVINVSLRSRDGFDCSKIAVHFGGGGHKYASGIKKLKGNIFKIKKEIFTFAKNNIDNIKFEI